MAGEIMDRHLNSQQYSYINKTTLANMPTCMGEISQESPPPDEELQITSGFGREKESFDKLPDRLSNPIRSALNTCVKA